MVVLSEGSKVVMVSRYRRTTCSNLVVRSTLRIRRGCDAMTNGEGG
jgi:hypothetical protein